MPTRYKIKATTPAQYQDIRALLEANNVTIFVASDKRFMLSTGDLSKDLITQVETKGGVVTLDTLLNLEQPVASSRPVNSDDRKIKK